MISRLNIYLAQPFHAPSKQLVDVGAREGTFEQEKSGEANRHGKLGNMVY